MSSTPAPSSLTGLLVGVVASALMASMGLLQYGETRIRVEAAAVAGELRTVAEAALAYEASTGDWPPDGRRGEVPEGLAPFLGPVEFADRRHALEWDRFGISDPGNGHIVGVTLRAADRRLLGSVIAEMAGEYPYFVAGNQVTWLLPERSRGGGHPVGGQELPGG